MNEVGELSKLDPSELPRLKPVVLDDLYQAVLRNLHLELGSGPVLYLISPNYSVLTPSPDEAIVEFLNGREALLDHLKGAVVRNLALYSAVLDVNSYFIEQNAGLVLARLRELDSGGRRYEIKFYTHAPDELLSRYEDKIYIGRDFLDLLDPVRRHFGVGEHFRSLADQYGRMAERLDAGPARWAEFRPYLQEIGESVAELAGEGLAALDGLPPTIDPAGTGADELLAVNAGYRAIAHYLIELNDAVGEFENHLRSVGHADHVRYVTKYRKDVTNLIALFNIKINGPMSRELALRKPGRGHGKKNPSRR